MNLRTIARVAFAGLAAAEAGFAMQRWQRRRTTFAAAVRRALDLGRPLVVVGDPHAGAHTSLMPAYGCGDLCIDLRGCPRCESYRAADITRGPIAGIADDSAVVFVSCVFEYVDDLEAARREILRIAGDSANVFAVTVQPWSRTSPRGAGPGSVPKPRTGPRCSWTPVVPRPGSSTERPWGSPPGGRACGWSRPSSVVVEDTGQAGPSREGGGGRRGGGRWLGRGWSASTGAVSSGCRRPRP